ncbi:glycosyltransferase family 1 protein [Clostridium oceanicum]|uniref:Glycosyltransferase family 1 protein n=1 Tax=Clostridium oceanicum TaxID=1543 RepID=A0ABN1JPJ8_9CLOT
MKISIDGRGINWYKGTGIGTYTEKILKHMINKYSEDFFNIYWSGDNYQSFKKENTRIIMTSKRYSRFFEQYFFPHDLNIENPDIYHVPQNGIGLSEYIHCKKISTIHDLIPYIMPETVGKGYLYKFLRDMPKIINLSDSIITVSNQSKKDIIKFFNVDKDKIFSIPLAADEKYKPLDKEHCKNTAKNKYNITKPYILYLGGFSARKNVKSLILAFSKIYNKLNKEYQLVIVGSKKDRAPYLEKLTSTFKIKSNIIFTGFVPEDDLPILYNGSDAFVYPSLYEGFGLPLLEAMSCATPIITSNVSSIPEVVSDSALLIDPSNLDDLSNSIEKLINNSALQKTLSEKGYARSKLFSWEKTASSTFEVYKKLSLI